MSQPINVPTRVQGTPSRLQLMEVVTLNADGTVDLRLAAGRTGKQNVPVGAFYTPAIGDHVVVGDLGGDPQAPFVLGAIDGHGVLSVGGITVVLTNDPRLADSRPPSGAAGGSLAGTYPNPTVAAGAITNTEVAAANKDGVAATPSMRTLGTGSQQAAAGNDTRLSDSRVPTGAAGGSLAGTYPNPTIAAGFGPVTGDMKQSALAGAQTGWLVCDGSAVTVASGNTVLRSALIAGGSVYGTTGTDPLLPDMRGRTPIGTGTGTGLTARALGSTVGEENHVLVLAELATHNHGGSTGTGSTGTGTTGSSSTGTGTTGTGSTGTGTSGNDSPDHSHAPAVGGVYVGNGGATSANITTGGGGFTTSAGGGASNRHTHTIPALSIPGLSIPALTVPGLSIPSLSVSALSIANAGSNTAHNTMQPSLALTWLIKT